MDFCIYWAAFVLGVVILANFIAPGKLGYERNLVKMEPFIADVFRVHSGYIVLTMLGMLLACVFYHAELKEAKGMWFGFNLFMALFWGSRALMRLFVYDVEIKRRYPIYNLMFATTFLYLGFIFSFLTVSGV